MLDGGAFVAGLEYATGVEATVVGKPSAACFAAALAALDAEPELTWMVGDDIDADVAGATHPGADRARGSGPPGRRAAAPTTVDGIRRSRRPSTRAAWSRRREPRPALP